MQKTKSNARHDILPNGHRSAAAELNTFALWLRAQRVPRRASRTPPCAATRVRPLLDRFQRARIDTPVAVTCPWALITRHVSESPLIEYIHRHVAGPWRGFLL